MLPVAGSTVASHLGWLSPGWGGVTISVATPAMLELKWNQTFNFRHHLWRHCVADHCHIQVHRDFLRGTYHFSHLSVDEWADRHFEDPDACNAEREFIIPMKLIANDDTRVNVEVAAFCYLHHLRTLTPPRGTVYAADHPEVDRWRLVELPPPPSIPPEKRR